MGTETQKQIETVLYSYWGNYTLAGLSVARSQGLAMEDVIDLINARAATMGLGPFDRECISERIMKRLLEARQHGLVELGGGNVLLQ